ncbi:MAG: ion channel [Bacteroidota bacterium]
MTFNDLTNRLRRPRAEDTQQDEIVNRSANDLGLGEKVARNPGTRLIKTDGDFNVERHGGALFSPYQQLIEMPWLAFLFLVFLTYVGLNLLFGFGFFLIGMESLSGIDPGASALERFAQAFFFSVQTFTTVGYGAVSPIGTSANVLASITALTGLLSVALATGLIFARFASPKAQITFSERALIGPYRDTGLNSFQFRIANRRHTQLINLHANVILSWLETDSTNTSRLKRRFAPLTLERDSVALFPLNWTIVHPITEDSPIYGWTKDDFCRRYSEVLIMIEGYDQTYAQTIHANSSYTHYEVTWNARFAPMFFEKENTTILHLNKIDEMVVLEEE